MYLGGGGMESHLRFYRSSDGIYGYRSRIPGRFRHAAGEGDTSVFGLLGAALALISCVLGDFLSIIGFAAKDYDMTFFEVLAGVDYGEIFSVMVKNVVSMSALFYGIAVYEGYKLSFRAQKHPVGGKI